MNDAKLLYSVQLVAIDVHLQKAVVGSSTCNSDQLNIVSNYECPSQSSPVVIEDTALG